MLPIPWHFLRGARLAENLVKVGADLIGIDPINRRRLIFEQFILFVVAEKVRLRSSTPNDCNFFCRIRGIMRHLVHICDHGNGLFPVAHELVPRLDFALARL